MGLFGKLRKKVAPAEDASAEERFRREVIEIARAAPFIASVSEDPESYALDLVFSDGDQVKCFLGNLWAETRDVDPEQRKLRIAHFLAVTAERPEHPDSFEDAERMLMPVLRPTTFFALGSGPAEPGKQPVRRAVLPFLCQAIAIDHPSAMAYAIVENLEGWGIDDERAHRSALENLARVANDGIELYDPRAEYPIWHVASGDSYESSRLLLPGWLASFEGKVDGRPVAAVPERSTLLVTGDANLDALARLIDSADREFRAAPRSISPALYTTDGAGGLVPFRVAPDHPLAKRVHAGEVHLAAVEYGSQKERLQQELTARGADVFVASYSVIERRTDGAIVSYCTWGQDVDALLPITDLVAFIGHDPDAEEPWHFLVPWTVAERELGDRWRLEPAVEPARMKTVRWPEASVLEALRRQSVD